MEHIHSSTELKNAIQLLEIEREEKEKLLREQFLISFESLKPINLLKDVLKEISSSSMLTDNILGSSLGLTSGYVTRKVVVGNSGNIFRNIFGSIMQFAVTNLVAQHPDMIKSFGHVIIQNIFHNKENKSGKM